MFTAALFIIAKRVGAPHVPTDEGMDTQDVIYMYNGILFSLKQEGDSDTSYHMDEP